MQRPASLAEEREKRKKEQGRGGERSGFKKHEQHLCVNIIFRKLYQKAAKMVTTWMRSGQLYRLLRDCIRWKAGKPSSQKKCKKEKGGEK